MKNAIIGLVVLAVLGGLGFVLLGGDDEDTSSTSQTSETETNEEPSDIEAFTAAQVTEHATEDDCWMIINDNVYDLTSYVAEHPGEEEILRGCGIDGTSLFTSRTTEEGETVGSGTAHSGDATAELEDLFVGQLEN